MDIAASVGRQANDIAGVGWDFRFYENDIQHGDEDLKIRDYIEVLFIGESSLKQSVKQTIKTGELLQKVYAW